MKLGKMKEKLLAMEEAPVAPTASAPGAEMEDGEMMAEESVETEEPAPVELASVSDEDLLAEAKKRQLI